MIPLPDKASHVGSLQPVSGQVPDALIAPFSAPIRRALRAVVVYALAAFVLAPVALAQSEPSFQAPSSAPAGQTGQETGTAATIPSPTEAPPEYRVGWGDVLGVTVYNLNMQELDRTTIVGSDGTLLLSYFPEPLKVDGETAQQIGQEIASELKHLQILLDPQVSVAVIRVESKPIVVGGDVRYPQVLQETRPFTLLQALMLAGGPQSDAGNSVLVTRTSPNGKVVSFDLQLSKVLSGTGTSSNIDIEPGDTIQVLPRQKVFVAGAVKAPGAFGLGRDQKLTVAKLMALSGGWTAVSDPDKAVIVRQDSNGQRQTLPLNLRKIMARKEPDVVIEANDLLYVPGSTGKTVSLAALKGVGGAAMVALGYLIVR